MKNDYPVQDSQNPGDESSLPTIVVNNRQLSEVLDDAWAAIHASNNPPDLFLFKGKLVRIVQIEGHPTIRRVNVAAMNGKLMRAANWIRQTKKTDLAVYPPGNIARVMLALPDEALPVLKDISGAGSSGLLGYQPDTHLFLYRDRDPNMESE